MKIKRLVHYGILIATVSLVGCASTSKAPHQPNESSVDHRHYNNVWDRIRNGYQMSDLNDPLVNYWVNYYAQRPGVVESMARRSSKYIHYVTIELEKRGMPTELALLPFVESAYKTNAYSRSKASGLWQFIPSTGTDYNLAQTNLNDDRRNPVKSTQAALDYLAYLYEFQGGDWNLALASYNWGQGAVKRAVERNESQGLSSDFSSLNLPQETRNYVPKLLALKKIITNPSRYGITLPNIPDSPYFEEVAKSQDIDVNVAAKLAGMSVDEFKELNAGTKSPVILEGSHSNIILPKSKVAQYKKNLSEYKGQLASWQGYNPQPGESLASIADRFGISLEQLKRMNGYGPRQYVALSSRTLLVPKTNMGVSPATSNDIQETQPVPATTRKPNLMLASDVQVVSKAPAQSAPVSHMTQPTLVSNTATSSRSSEPDLLGDMIQKTPAVASRVPTMQAPGLAPAPNPADTADALTNMLMANSTPPTHMARAVPASYDASEKPKAHVATYVVQTRKPQAVASSQTTKAVKTAKQPSTHTVKKGETLYSLARRYNTTVEALTKLNKLKPNGLRTGMQLRIPSSSSKG